ncbi:MAG: rRNA pseudouridine synthase [Polyangiaceae bacterium]|nr:rRNA pseudouridine synthase [Polyangiaceae bacterium]
MAVDRLQKVLARAGVASRRAAEQLIADGKVRVNGRIVTEMGLKVDGYRDKIEVNGRRIVAEKPAYYLFHKPKKVVATLHDPEGRDTIADVLGGRIPERVHPVGRLDYHTSGALLLTNDGQMTEALLRPRRAVPKIYVVKVQGLIEVEALDQLRRGVLLDDGYRTKPAELFILREEGENTWMQITLTEGKNRQIHRMLEAVGHRVMRLARTEFAGISTDGLRPGELRRLKERELEKLKKNYLAPYRASRGGTHVPGGPAADVSAPVDEDFEEGDYDDEDDDD